ncbi:hypothetical protein E8E14_001701 [Neopestalotiopsis sp. 37M]|nr:hypothetical protein E8E14_001701 [Neopestalotiopsis sp. 37M]
MWKQDLTSTTELSQQDISLAHQERTTSMPPGRVTSDTNSEFDCLVAGIRNLSIGDSNTRSCSCAIHPLTSQGSADSLLHGQETPKKCSCDIHTLTEDLSKLSLESNQLIKIPTTAWGVPDENDIKALYEFDSRSSGRSITTPKKLASPFLSLPRELRDQVYRELLTVDQVLSNIDVPGMEWPFNFSGLVILGVNRQIRNEGWEMLLHGNTWVQVRVCGSSNLLQTFLEETRPRGPDGKRLCGPTFVTDGYPWERIRQLQESSVVTICLGDESGVQDKQKLPGKDFRGLSLLLPYRQSLWPRVLESLAQEVHTRHSVHIACRGNVLQDTSISGRAFKTIIEGMFVIRGAVHASASGCGDALDTLVSKIMTPIRSTADLIELGLKFHRAGNEYSHKGDYYAAMQYYEQGAMAIFNQVEPADDENMIYGSANTLADIGAQCNCSWSMNVTLAISKRFNHGLRKGAFVTAHDCSLLCRSLDRAQEALWPGADDELRGKAHFAAGCAYALMARLKNITLRWCGLSKRSCEENAARELWYAKRLSFPTRTWHPLLYPVLCPYLEQNPDLDWPLRTVEIPALGTWTSDPNLLHKWGRCTVMMRLFRQRSMVSLGEALSDVELEDLYFSVGIEFWVEEDDTVVAEGDGIPSWIAEFEA